MSRAVGLCRRIPCSSNAWSRIAGEVGDVPADVLLLLGEDGARVALVAGPEQHHALEQLRQDADRQALGLDRDGAAGPEREQVQAAERRRVLVLPPDRLAEDVDLDVAGLLRQLPGRDTVAAVAVEGVQQPDRERARAPEAGRGRQVAHGADVDRRVDVEELEGGPGDVVLQLVDRVDLLGQRVVDADRLVEDLAVALDRDPDVLVDRAAQDGAVFALVERGQVRPASREAHAHRRPGDDQGRSPHGRPASHRGGPSRRGSRPCWAEAEHLVRVVGLRPGVGQDHLLVAVRLVAVGDARRDLDQDVVVLAEEDLLQLALRRRVLADVVEDELRPARDDRVVDRHRLMDVPGLDGARPGGREVDLAEGDEVGVRSPSACA
jgi:hypothetical protein